MSGTGRSAKDVLEELRRSPVQKVKVAVTDIDGVLRGKYLHKDKFLSAVRGRASASATSCSAGTRATSATTTRRYTGWHTGYPDALARIDLATYRSVPWDDGVPFFLGDFVDGDGGAARRSARASS